jgi:hypothetical protein
LAAEKCEKLKNFEGFFDRALEKKNFGTGEKTRQLPG